MRVVLQAIARMIAALCIAVWILLEGDTPRPR